MMRLLAKRYHDMSYIIIYASIVLLLNDSLSYFFYHLANVYKVSVIIIKNYKLHLFNDISSPYMQYPNDRKLLMASICETISYIVKLTINLET